ncbi:MAG: hypothetical protein UR39_C0001G0073 [Candidatus Woesebacteria bacterium GW2011_GWA1_33_30]|uniref:SGNH hydrolase-type esterase domain-containing protein n=1 Tax=Candidatus Woesebacteria bacterium GW2011_GWA2_33_28 TaxID=1618561 RepID=A0A0F9ZV26_9BACT|nr:MAG: hypothetical protein UR38_C0001G0074 [Candidatus Woesebacteria bacterium GW2011_GWA2_33_28]KKP49040.1 MAG: hypothetical protein UR39_C0001G0073 [Candidatus Woesebacteria bacterium GW2011_GWA1_33_30]KKP49852.1 MAG: hypothetical protein UR40_C0003G0024 [Microgenomates group bacterium GW2011_GWC1_33_32]KKP52632.1 MAG: hypothetical protein UR44_C0001G0074 [Candidatus Woesebacteria bacterium GW2011_GWB1_33_38]KKP58809.1 MAG: hypothetical protein UR48_C0001G0013 [Microgenomates group bacteriu
MILLEDIKQKLNNNGKYWIAFVGDSITSCEWVHPNWREIVEYVLQEEMTKFMGDWQKSEWGIRGFNLALDGSTTKDILDRVDTIKLISPDLVIGLMGGNDPVLGIDVQSSVENVIKIVNKLNTQVVWCNSTPAGDGSKKNKEYEPYAKAFMDVPGLPNLQKIDMFSIYQKFSTEKFFTFISEENSVEGIKAGEVDLQHPNQLGNAYIAKVILKEVFNIDFDPELYIKTTLSGEKFPKY